LFGFTERQHEEAERLEKAAAVDEKVAEVVRTIIGDNEYHPQMPAVIKTPCNETGRNDEESVGAPDPSATRIRTIQVCPLTTHAIAEEDECVK
jgi:hypothetical protein